MACLEVLGVEVLVLEARYVDDYQIMWKSDPSLPLALMDIIGDIVKDFVLRRYPLPLKPDLGSRFIGMDLCGQISGTVALRPVLEEPPAYNDIGHPPLMSFHSFAPMAMKRAMFLGILSRIDVYTVPQEDKAKVLSDTIGVLSSWHDFPQHLMRRWAHSCSQNFPWVFDLSW